MNGLQLMAKVIYYAKKEGLKIAAASVTNAFFWVRPDLPRFFVSSTKM